MNRILVSLLALSLILSGCGRIPAESGADSSTLPDSPHQQEQASEKTPEVDTRDTLLWTLAQKPLEEYTLENLTLLLTASVDELCTAYGLDITQEPSGGLLLPNATLATPVIFLTNGLFITAPLQQGQEMKVEPSALPKTLYLSGDNGQSTPVDGFFFGMKLDEERLNTKNSTYKISEAGDFYSAKQVDIFQNGLAVSLFFEQDMENGAYCLEIMRAVLSEQENQESDDLWADLFSTFDRYGYPVEYDDLQGNTRSEYSKAEAELAEALGQLGYVVLLDQTIVYNKEQVLKFVDALEESMDTTITILALTSSGPVIHVFTRKNGEIIWTQYDCNLQERKSHQIAQYEIADITMTETDYLVYQYYPFEKDREQTWTNYMKVDPLPDECMEPYWKYVAPIQEWRNSEWDQSSFIYDRESYNADGKLGFIETFLQSLWQWEQDTADRYSAPENQYWEAELVEHLYQKYFNFSPEATRSCLEYHEEFDGYYLRNDGGYGMVGFFPEVWGVVNNSDGSITMQLAVFEVSLFEFPISVVYCNLTVMPREDGTFYYIDCKATEKMAYPFPSSQ